MLRPPAGSARLGTLVALPFLAEPALGQAPGREPSAPKRIDQSPFRRIDVGDLRIELMALSDEACPLQIRSGRVGSSPGRHRALWVDVKSLSAPPIASYALVTLVFDAAGRLKGTRRTAVTAALAQGKGASVELALDYSDLATGDWLVVAVEHVALAENDWRSDPEELQRVAAEQVRLRVG
jgi:hypothetical protein